MRKWLTGIGRTMKNVWKHKIKADQAGTNIIGFGQNNLEHEYEFEREKK